MTDTTIRLKVETKSKLRNIGDKIFGENQSYDALIEKFIAFTYYRQRKNPEVPLFDARIEIVTLKPPIDDITKVSKQNSPEVITDKPNDGIPQSLIDKITKYYHSLGYVSNLDKAIADTIKVARKKMMEK